MIEYLMDLYINVFDSVFTKIFHVEANSPEQYGIMVAVVIACMSGYCILDKVIEKMET